MASTSTQVSKDEKMKLPTHLHLLSGALSGFASCVLLQPLDLLKTRVQQGRMASLTPPAAVARTTSTPFSSTLVVNLNVVDAARGVVRENGALGLWRGTAPTVVRNVPGVAMYFYTLTELRTLFNTLPALSRVDRDGSSNYRYQTTTVLPKLTPTGDLIAGAIARTSVGFILTPITVIKARFESDLYAYPSIRNAFSSILSSGGVRALWSGFWPTAMRDAPYAGLFVLSYEHTKSLLITTQTSMSLTPSMIHGLSASVGALLATVLTTPFDYIKTQQQIRPDIHKTFRQSVVLVWRRNGWKGFFDGASLRIARKAASSVVGWTIYEGLIRRWAT